MSFRNTGILLVVLVVLGGVVFVVNRQGGPQPETDATPTPAPLTSLSAADVASLTVEQGDQSITVERDGESWVVAGDSPEDADAGEVIRAVDRLTGLKPTRTLADIQSLSDFGLDEPAWTIALTPGGGETVVYRVGDENPRGTARYVQLPGDPVVYLVSKVDVETVQGWLEKPPYPPTPTPVPTQTPAPAPTATP